MVAPLMGAAVVSAIPEGIQNVSLVLKEATPAIRETSGLLSTVSPLVQPILAANREAFLTFRKDAMAPFRAILSLFGRKDRLEEGDGGWTPFVLGGAAIAVVGGLSAVALSRLPQAPRLPELPTFPDLPTPPSVNIDFPEVRLDTAPPGFDVVFNTTKDEAQKKKDLANAQLEKAKQDVVDKYQNQRDAAREQYDNWAKKFSI